MAKECYRREMIGCFGMPIDENPTVVIMEAAFRKMGLDYIYNGSEVIPADLPRAVDAIRALHWLGANVTVPHKVTVMDHLDVIDESARIIGAVNTIYWKDGRLCGANTDGKGFVGALNKSAVQPAGKRYVILGAGGAAKAIAVELALAGAEKLTIVNRTVEKAESLAKTVRDNTPAQAEAAAWSGEYALPRDTNVVVNATSIGLFPDQTVPAVDFNTMTPEMLVCDVIPNPPTTPFLERAAQLGCRTLNGMSMLVQQGVIALKIWTGKDADADAMLGALEAEFR